MPYHRITDRRIIAELVRTHGSAIRSSVDHLEILQAYRRLSGQWRGQLTDERLDRIARKVLDF